MSTSKTNKVWSGIAFVLAILTVGFAIWLFLNRQLALDKIAVWSYTPPASIQSIDERVQFTDKGKFIFYATKPAVATPEVFNSKCPRQEEMNPILGCYTSDDRIYVFNVTDQALDGIKEVTAAHEMLHAVWMRMDDKDREKVEPLLQAAYEKNANTELRDRMAYYQRTEPDSIMNELHSILGTEMNNLGPELDTYYSQYFKDRQIILSLHAKYNALYTELNNRANELYAAMDTLSKSIQTRSTAYEAATAQLSADISAFNSRAHSGAFTSMSEFNSERAALVARSNQLEAERQAINNDIATYNAMYDEYQTIASQLEKLNNSIDSFKALEETPTI